MSLKEGVKPILPWNVVLKTTALLLFFQCCYVVLHRPPLTPHLQVPLNNLESKMNV
jgi:hypothetical protein